ncbi:MAG: cell division protein FtsZ, partial [Ruminococcaceae bacterium]|nr:cell division protein FtsZ [Oscillospiraceae bacterium]
GVGSATGKDKAEQAAREAISSPLLETSIKGAKGILISMAVSENVNLDDVDLAATLISQEASTDANVIWGVSFDPELEDEMKITIIATGFEKKPEDAARGGVSVKTNPGSPFKKETPAEVPADKPIPPAPKAAPEGRKPAPAKPGVRPVRPAPPKPADEDEFDDILDMVKNTRKKN